MKLRSMALTKSEAKNGIECAPSMKDDGPRYPYGLEITLDNAALKKLGLDGDLPQVGAQVRIRAEACVTSVSSNQYQDGDKNCSVRLQIERLAVDEAEPETMEEAIERGVRQA